jgi:thymidylate synthase
MNNLDKQYTDLLQDILDNGVQKGDRTGTGTISVFSRQIRHKMSDGFPLLTTKKMPFKTIVTELLWFLKGDTNIKYLVDNNCHIWDGDAYKNYLCKLEDEFTDQILDFTYSQEEFIQQIKTDDEFAKKWGELGPIYGKQWRNCGYREDLKLVDNNRGDFEYEKVITTGIDQIANLINDLKTNPDSRRLMVNAWNVGELDQMVLPPCHTDFQFFTRELSFEERCKIQIDKLDGMYSSEKDLFIHHSINAVKQIKMDENNIPQRAISLMWNQRSVDSFLGLPFNIASYGLLLKIIAKEVNMVPDELIGNLGDTHLYLNHIEQAKEQIGRLTIEERMDYWFKNNKPNRDVCDSVDEYSLYIKEAYFDHAEVPRTSREPFELPTLNIKLHFKNEPSFTPEYWLTDDFELLNYQSHPTIKAPLSN